MYGTEDSLGISAIFLKYTIKNKFRIGI